MAPQRPKRTKKPAPTRWGTRQRQARSKPKVVIVGVGRLGGALALGLKKAGWPCTVFPHSGDSVRRAVELKLKLAEHEDFREADLCLLAVPDHAVGRVAATVHDDLGPHTALLHCAGALDLSAFGGEREMVRRPRGSFHPLCAISDSTDDLAGHSVALAATDRALLATLFRMAVALRLRPLEVPEARRAAYHAGAVLAAGLAVGLISAASRAFEEAGILEDNALHALIPLTHSALRGVELRGLSRGLTGPVARGDVAVVEAHLRALPADVAAIYRVLSLRTLELVRDQLPAETRNAFERLLRS